MAWITDSLSSVFKAIAPQLHNGVSTYAFTHHLAIAAYMSSGMLRKVIKIPAADRTQKWRDWQADKEAIAEIEKEERRLNLRAKTKQAEVLRGVGGGALLIITAGEHESELKPDQIGKGGLVAINVLSRWQLQGLDWVDDLADPDYGNPRMFEINSGRAAKKIHPSRVICFRGDPLPAGSAVSMDDAFWGDSRLTQVYREVERSDETKKWFAALVRKAKLLRIGIPNLSAIMASPDGKANMTTRIKLIAQSESLLDATLYDLGDGTEGGGEKVEDYQVTWAGIPAVMDSFDQHVAAVADIPFTRLMGRSPAGMNATGDHDTDNWNDAVADGQENETRPCLEKLDPILLRSAGVAKPDEITWKWAPLWTPTEAEEAETFDKFMTAITKVLETGALPDVAFAEAFQNWLEEREYLPGLAAALAKISEAERFHMGPTEEEIRAELEAEIQAAAKGGDPGSAGGGGQPPARRAANDAAPRTLYVQRPLLNTAEFIAWAKSQGFDTTTSADELHVTITYSKQPVDWMKMGSTWDGNDKGELIVPPGGARIVEPLGDKGAVVLLFNSSSLAWRHEEMIRNGASHDFPEYQPHVTITYAKPEGLDLSTVEPFRGELRFGPEIFEELTEGWRPSEA